MLDRWWLKDDIALADRVHALALVLEGGPAVRDEYELERAFMNMPVLDFVLLLLAVGADDMGDITCTYCK